MSALAGPLHLVALVLVVSGAQKLGRPQPAGQAMADAGLPVPVRRQAVAGLVLGATEVATGLAVFAAPHPATALWLAATYLGLAAFVVVLRRRDASASCGCFGSASTPPTTAHVALNAAAAGVALAAAVAGVPDVVEVVDEGVGVALPYALLVAIGAGLVLLSPTLLAQVRPVADRPGVRLFGPTETPGALR